MPICWLILTVVMMTWYIITVIVVAIRGYEDLKNMFKNMQNNR